MTYLIVQSYRIQYIKLGSNPISMSDVGHATAGIRFFTDNVIFLHQYKWKKKMVKRRQELKYPNKKQI